MPPPHVTPDGQLLHRGEKLDGEWNGSAYPDYGIYTYANGDRCGRVRVPVAARVEGCTPAWGAG
eukprot:6872090-Prymnesium_polylepis.1